MKNFIMDSRREGRCYMWRQRFIHWAQLIGLVGVICAGGIGITECYNCHKYYHIDRYVVNINCPNCGRSTRAWPLQGESFDDKHIFKCEKCCVGLKGPTKK